MTIQQGSVIDFDPGQDRHQFRLGSDDLTEIFVYGKLITKGKETATDSVRFQKKSNPSWSGDYAWGGIRIMPGGSIDLNHTSIRDMAPPPAPPTDLTAQVGNEGVTLKWVLPKVKDPTITKWAYRVGTISGADTTWADWQNVGDVATTSYLVKGLINGTKYTFQVAAVNPAGRGPASDPSAAVTAAGPPEPPELTVAAGHERVRVSWTPGADNGSKIERHEWRYKAGAADWDPDWTVYVTPEQIIRNLDNDTTYTFQMKSKNKVGYSEVVEAQATPRHPIKGPTAISFTENSDDPVASYRFAPAELDKSLVNYSLKLSDIADSGLFELDSQGRLRFQDAPDFETPTDGDGDGIYTVWLKAAPVAGNGTPVRLRRTAPPATFTKQVEVTVTNADDPGAIALSPLPPQVGMPLTAELTDQDGGVRGISWQWQGQAPGTTRWQPLSSTSGSVQSSYTPQAAQVGWVLQAMVHYRDMLGAGKSAESMPTAPVQGLPTAPENLTAAVGDTSVTLTWEAPTSDGGAAITGYAYRYRAGDSAPWQPSEAGTTIHETTFYVRDTISGLTNGTAYTFEVWAVNAVGEGAVASVVATPAGVPDPPEVTATELDGEVALTIRLTADNGSKVTHIEWLNSHINGVPLNNRWGWVSGFADHRYPELFREGYTHRWEGLQNDLVYRFEVRVRNGQGASEIVSVTATPTDPRVAPPRHPDVGTPTSRSAPVEWEAPASTTGLAGYQVEWRVDGDTRWNSQNIPAATTHYTIPNLSSDTTYNWRVSSRASAGYAPSKPVEGDDFTTATPPSTTFRFIPPRTMESATVGLQYVFNRPNPVGSTGNITYATTSTGGGLKATTTGLSGTPTATGSFDFTWTATDGAGHTAIFTLTLTIRSPTDPPAFDEDSIAYAVQAGSTFNDTLPSAQGADSYETVGTIPGYVTVNLTTLAIAIRPENTHVGGPHRFIVRARNPHGTDSLTVNVTVTAAPPPPTQTQYAYRAWQTAPQYDSAAAGIPAHWSATALTWTDAAPRVWRIRRTSLSGGGWSAWGSRSLHSQRPAASAPFYRRASSAPSTPRTQTGVNIATPRGWQTTPPTATTTQGVWTTTATRAAGATQWLFSAPTQETPPTRGTAPGLPRNFAADPGSPLTPGSIDLDWDAPTSGGTPTSYRVEYRFASGSWLLGATPTLTNASLVLARAGALYQFRVRAENSGGTSGWVETTGTTSEQAQPPETESAYRLHTSGTTAPTFTASASTVPTGWYSSRQTPTASARYEWRISRSRPRNGSWSNWGSATVVRTYEPPPETESAYRLHTSGTTAPSFTATASGVPSDWSSSRPTPNPHERYEWRISRTRPTGGSWSSWGSATVVSTYTERRTAYRLHTSGTTAPSFTATASGVPSDWSSSRPTPNPHERYVWQISRTRPTDGSWSSWGSATVVSTYTERRTAYRLHTSGTTAPTFTASASGVPSGWSSSRRTTNPHERYEWEISRTRPTGGSWSSWGSATVVSTYTERQTAYRLHTSGTTAPTFTASASGVPSGWSSSRRTTNPHERYVWQISRTRPTGGSWSDWGSATVVSTYTARQATYRWNNSGTTFPVAATLGTDAGSRTIKGQRRLVIAPGGPASLAAASGFGIGTMAGRIGMPARRPKRAS